MSTKSIYNIGVIGTGIQGQRFINLISKIDSAKVACVSNTRREPVQGIPCFDWKHMLHSNKLDGVIVAATPELHHNVLHECNELKIPVLLEKPAGVSLVDIQFMRGYSIPILVNYVHLFSPQYIKVKAALVGRKVNSMVCFNYNQGPFRTFSSLADYGVHDLAIALDLVGDAPFEIVSKLATATPNEGMIYKLTLKLKDCTISLKCGNGATYKKHQVACFTDHANFIYDQDNEADYQQPLKNVISHFLQVINGEKVIVPISHSLRIHDLLDRLSQG